MKPSWFRGKVLGPEARFARTLIAWAAFVTVMFVIYGGFANPSNIDFTDLGPFSPYPQIASDWVYFTWIHQGLGYNGHELPYGLFESGLTILLGAPGLAQKVWFFSLFPTCALGIYLLIRQAAPTRRLEATVAAFAYAFNPFTVGLVFQGSVNDTLTCYAILPYLLLLAWRSFEMGWRQRVASLLGLALLSSYGYYWNTQIVMWIGPLFIVYLIVCLLKSNTLRALSANMIIGAGFVALFIILSQSFTYVTQIISGNGNVAFQGAASNTASTANLVYDLSVNFNGQLSYWFWYGSLFVLLVNILIWNHFKNEPIARRFGSLHFAIVTECLLILGTWMVFHNGAAGLVSLIARYLPVLAAYEPFFGITLAFSLLFTDLSIVLIATGLLRTILGVTSGELMWLRRINWRDYFGRRRGSSVASPRSKPMVGPAWSNRRVWAVPVATLLLASALTVPSIQYWQQTQNPSILQMIPESASLNERIAVPYPVYQAAQWLKGNGPLDQEYKILLIPQGLYSFTQFQNYVPWASFLSINQSLYNALYSMVASGQVDKLADMLSVYGVKYIVLDKGPYSAADPSYAASGPARFGLTGFYWNQMFPPYGSWQNWSALMSHASNWTTVANLTGVEIYSNALYVGSIFAFDVGGENVNLGTLGYLPSQNSILLPAASNLVTSNWQGLNQTPWMYNWTVTTEQTGQTVLTAGPLPPNQTYTNLWQPLPLQPGTWIRISFEIAGLDMNHSGLYLRLFSAPSLNGQIVFSGVWIYSGTFVTPHLVSLEFLLPATFESAALYPTYQENLTAPSASIATFSNISVVPMKVIRAEPVDYHFLDPTHAVIVVHGGSLLLVVTEAFNDGWHLSNASVVEDAVVYYNGLYSESVFMMNGSNTNQFTLEFSPQAMFVNLNIATLGAWVFSVATIVWLRIRRTKTTP